MFGSNMLMFIVGFAWGTAGASNCSGRGSRYLEDVALGLPATCECDQCYTGAACEDEVSSCIVDVTTVELTAFGEWFLQAPVARDAQCSIGSGYHPGYLATPSYLAPRDGAAHAEPRARMSSLLNATIRGLHQEVGNVPLSVARDYQLVIGAGAMQLLTAAVWALSDTAPDTPLVARAPYWGEFKAIAQVLAPRVQWAEAANVSADGVVEIVTTPNNPDGGISSPLLPGSQQIFDLVYDWPMFANVSKVRELLQRAQPQVVIFSLSKMSGYAATRFGWALVKSPLVAERMGHYIFVQGQGTGVESQYRAARLLRTIWQAGHNYIGHNYIGRDFIGHNHVQ